MPRGVFIRTEEHRRKLSESKKGHLMSEETKRKMSLAHKGKSNGNLGHKHTEKSIQKMRDTHKKIGTPWLIGKKQSPELIRKRVSKMIGENNPNWQGGITPINNKIRCSIEYKLWSDSVKNRDNNCCQKCRDDRVSKIMAHHILNFSSYFELRFTIDNGITFCRLCHKEFHHIYGKKNNNKEQVIEFLLQRNG